MRFVPSAVLFLLLAGPAQAIMLCSQPSPPWCVDIDRTYTDRSAMMNCRGEVEEYAVEIEDYAGCLAEKVKAVTLEAEKVRERFECRAAGKECL